MRPPAMGTHAPAHPETGTVTSPPDIPAGTRWEARQSPSRLTGAAQGGQVDTWMSCPHFFPSHSTPSLWAARTGSFVFWMN